MATFHAKSTGAYDKESTEAIENSQLIYSILKAKGWTLNAVCGVLGNIAHESGYNPWRWQGDSVQSKSNSPWTNIGYGLTQFTPAGKYINNEDAKKEGFYAPNFSDKSGSPTDGVAQINFLDKSADYLKTSTYNLTYDEYKVSNRSPSYLASAWLYNYERPADPSATVSLRQQDAEYWYKVLSGEDPPSPPVPPTPKQKKSKWIWFTSKWVKYKIKKSDFNSLIKKGVIKRV